MDINYKPLIFLYKHYKALVYGWAVFAGAVYVVFLSGLPVFHKNVFLIYLYFFVTLPLLYIFIPVYLRSVINRINNVLVKDCDPARYIFIYEDIIGELKHMKRPPKLKNFEFHLSTGLSAAGRYNEAYELISNVTISTNTRLGKFNSVIYYNNLLSVCLSLGNIDEAEENLDHMIKAIALLNPRDYVKYEKHLKRAQYSVNIARGVYDYTEKAFIDLFDSAENNYERVNARFSLAKVYLHSGDIPRAKEALEYVITHGNKLHIVEQAKEQLSHIQ